MEFLVSKLRDQVAHIVAGDHPPGTLGFTHEPADMTELSKGLERLAEMVAEREAVRKALAAEVHHRVKNNLQIVTSLLNMQASRIANPAAREALGQTQARIGALALIHRILYEKADDGSQATLDIARLISELCAQFRLWNRARTEIMFSWHSNSIAVPLDSAMPLALFAVEAITNAYAYAFPDRRSGTVLLHFKVNDLGAAQLSVTDNGVGFDCASNNQSMGRQLMYGFAQQLGGQLHIESSAETGTEVRLNYQLAG